MMTLPTQGNNLPSIPCFLTRYHPEFWWKGDSLYRLRTEVVRYHWNVERPLDFQEDTYICARVLLLYEHVTNQATLNASKIWLLQTWTSGLLWSWWIFLLRFDKFVGLCLCFRLLAKNREKRVQKYINHYVSANHIQQTGDLRISAHSMSVDGLIKCLPLSLSIEHNSILATH